MCISASAALVYCSSQLNSKPSQLKPLMDEDKHITTQKKCEVNVR